jgi:hypothetical protein
MVRNGQEWSGTVRDGERYQTVNGTKRLQNHAHGTVTLTFQKRKNQRNQTHKILLIKTVSEHFDRYFKDFIMPISVRTPIIIFYYSKDFDKTSNEKKIWDQFKESVNEYGNFIKSYHNYLTKTDNIQLIFHV